MRKERKAPLQIGPQCPQINVRLPIHLKKRLYKLAIECNTPVYQLCIEAVEELLNRRKIA